jgi:type IV secretory pathway VirB2 component (pilin)
MKVNIIPTKRVTILSAAFCAVMFAFSHNASAVPHPLPPVTNLATTIQGSITFSGGCTLDTGNANTAHSVTSWVNTVVQSVSGDFDTFINPLDAATFSAPWIFDPSTPTPALWSVGGFTFDLLSSTIVVRGGGFLSVSGTGTISGNGFDPTFGTWNFSTQNPGSNGLFSFSAASQAVPDGGATVALLGLTLVGAEVLRRKLKVD